MPKSLHTVDNEVLLRLLRTIRKEKDKTQTQVAEVMEWPQSYVSRYESGERRLDAVELNRICEALDMEFEEFARRYAKALKDAKLKK